eukprot:2829078-Amphidinium_carterae.1
MSVEAQLLDFLPLSGVDLWTRRVQLRQNAAPEPPGCKARKHRAIIAAWFSKSGSGCLHHSQQPQLLVGCLRQSPLQFLHPTAWP